MNKFKSLSIISVTLVMMLNNAQINAEETTFKINSDSSTIDLINKIMNYKGNTSFITNDISIIGDELKVYKKDQISRNIEVIGQPVKLLRSSLTLNQNTQLSANNIQYDISNKNIEANENIILIQKTIKDENHLNQQTFKVLGDHMSFLSEPEGIIKMSGSPLQITIQQDQQDPLTATAKEMIYNQVSQAFELSGDVFLSTDRDTIKAEKIIYDGKIIQIPESENKPVQMTQTIKDTYE